METKDKRIILHFLLALFFLLNFPQSFSLKILLLVIFGFGHLNLNREAISSKKNGGELILETVPLSHYVEKVRFCLDKLKIPYKENPDFAVIGIILKGRTVPTRHFFLFTLHISCFKEKICFYQ